MKTTTLLITTIIAVIALSVTACPNPGTEQPIPKHSEHKWKEESRDFLRWEDIRWNDKDGNELPEGEEGYWKLAYAPKEGAPYGTAVRSGFRTKVENVHSICEVCNETNDEPVRSPERESFDEEYKLKVGEKVENGEITKGNIALPSDKTSALITSPDAIDVVSIILGSGAGSEIISDDFTAEGIVEGVLKPLSAQAARLQEFFADCTGSVDIAGFPSFAKLQENQNAIRTGILGSTTVTPTGYLELVAGKDDVMDKLFASGDAKVLWDGYKAGHYAITRDWRLAGVEADCADEVSAFMIAAGKVDDPVSNWPGTHPDDRGFTITGMGAQPEYMLEQMEADLVNMGADLLVANGGVPTEARETAEAMVKALVVQFGQDTEQFRALVNDLQTDPTKFTEALGASYHKYNLQPEPVSPDAVVSMAPIGQQSVKLAALNRKRKSA